MIDLTSDLCTTLMLGQFQVRSHLFLFYPPERTGLFLEKLLVGITLFSGRGRFQHQMTEVEGLVSVTL
jgi:hypothetical protein